MYRWLLRIGCVLLALVVLLAALWGASRLRGATAEQRAALELFEQAPQPQGRNAWPLLWLLQWDVPEAELEAVAAEDVARFDALPRPGDPGRGEAIRTFESVAAGRYRDLADSLADQPASCGLRENGCLAMVRAGRDAHAARLEDARELVDRVEALAGYDHLHTMIPPAMDAPLPRLQWLGLPLTRHALWFADGEHERALAGSCRAISGYRRLFAQADSLISAMVGVAVLEGQASLLAQMLAELPPGLELPSECDEALAPLPPGGFSTCPAMRGEWGMIRSADEWMKAGLSEDGLQAVWLLYDPKATAALQASYLGWPCGEQAARMRAQDVPAGPPELRFGKWRFECWANVTGCIVSEIARPAYAAYEMRAQDATARLRLLQTLAWMRERVAAGDGRDARALLAENPPGPEGSPRSFEVDADGTRLRMSLFDERHDSHWSIPLPPALHAPASGAPAP